MSIAYSPLRQQQRVYAETRSVAKIFLAPAGRCSQSDVARGGRSRPTHPADTQTASIAAEQVLRNTRGVEDEVARSLKLAAQRRQIDIKQPPLPLAHFAGDDHGL